MRRKHGSNVLFCWLFGTARPDLRRSKKEEGRRKKEEGEEEEEEESLFIIM